MQHDLIYFFPWYMFSREQMPFFIREWLSNGVSRFVFTEALAQNCLKDPSWIPFLHRMEREYHVQFLSMHGVFGPDRDLNIIEKDLRPVMIADHIRCMEIAAEFGCRTYTAHIGTGHYIHRRAKLSEERLLVADTLEKLVAVAEKLGITIALENAFHPANAPRELLNYLQPYSGNPAVGICFDTGHANVMRMPPGKRVDRFRNYIHNCWYETGFIPQNDALDLLEPHIVTTHLHDNDGYGDQHAMPGDGTIDWQDWLPRLRACPRMMEMQTEVPLYNWGINWSGELPSPRGGYAIKDAVDTFRKLGF